MRPRRTGPSSAVTAALVAAFVVLAAASCGGDGASDEVDGGTSTTAAGDGATTSSASTEPADAAAPVEVPADDVEGFRAVPDPLPAVVPGQLVRYQDAGPFGGGTAFRVMYGSETVAGDPTVVTGVVVVPPGEAPDGGWPVLAHGHGSTGVADDCAPSRSVGAEGEGAGLATVELEVVAGQALPAGMVVASSDYEGQGGPGRHPFLVGPSEARSLLDAARAAGQLPQVEVDGRLVVAGYSQGGHAALWARQLAADWAPELDLVGTVSGAPVTRVRAMVAPDRNGGRGGIGLTLAAGLQAADADLDLDGVLTEAGAAALEALDESCTADAGVDAAADMLTVDVGTEEPWRSALDANDPGAEPGTGPLLLVHSVLDANVPVEDSRVMVDRLCPQGVDVELRELESGDHVAAAVPAYEQGVAWLRGLLDGDAPTSGCG